MSQFKYYINETEYTPINEGDFTFDISLNTENGAYQYEYSLNGTIVFNNPALQYVLLHDKTQEITLTIKETCTQGTFVIFDTPLTFTHYDCEFDLNNKTLTISPIQKSLFKCLTDAYDIKFNMLETPTVVTSIYSAAPVFLFEATTGPQPTVLPYYGEYIKNSSGVSPYVGFFVFGREIKTTYCQGGEPQAPAGAGWELEINNCFGGGFSQWTRKPLVFIPTTSAGFEFTFIATPGTPPYPSVPGNWLFMATIKNPSLTASFWVDYDAIKGADVEINNGRLFIDVLNNGLNKICPELDVQSQILNSDINPVTGVSPSDMADLQIHSISDVKDPNATEPATREDITIKEMLGDYLSAKANCYWRVDERTKRLIIEHYKDLNNQGTFDLTSFINSINLDNNKYSLDNSDIPKAEEFPSLDSSIDFTGVDIIFDNPVSKGKKAYNTDKFMSEVESIIQDPDGYPNDGFVIITKDSLAPPQNFDGYGDRAELGAITNSYSPNVPQGMANLQEKYWKYWRPFEVGELNFNPQSFTKNKPIKKHEPITIPLCCFYLFNPYSEFIGELFTDGQLQKASFSPKSQTITLNIQSNE